MKVVLFSMTALVSAIVMFSLEPLLAKLLLPSLGGASAVWNAALVFFQATLLLGYALAHLLARLGAKRFAVVHAALFALALLTLPLHLDTTMGQSWAPSMRVLGILTVGSGLLFLALAMNAPTLARHFSTLDHPDANDPYFLYAASNVGSALALVAYPFFVERYIGLATQARFLGYGFATLAALIVACCVTVLRGPGREATVAERSPPISHKQRGRWILLAALPSAYLVAVTQYFTTDVTPAPLLWVVPLFVYLGTFVLVFSKRLRPRHTAVARILPVFGAMAVLTLACEVSHPAILVVLLHLVTFTLIALLCHGELADGRPPPDRLTEFYLAMSAGGVLGGLLVALVAPAVFDRNVEYPVMILGGLALRPATPSDDSARRRYAIDAGFALGGAALMLLMVWVSRALHATDHVIMGLLGVPILVVYRTLVRPVRFALSLAAILAASTVFEPLGPALLHTRGFFGSLRVTNDPTGHFRRLVHGSTVHGAQNLDPAKLRTPTAYYYPNGPISDIFARHDELHDTSSRVAIIGLGAGGLAPYARSGESWTFYEINPDIVRIALDQSLFTYLSDTFPGGKNMRIDLGDARLRLEATSEQYEVIVMDAFTSDAIPVHLLTVEAMRSYVAHLRPHGLIAINCSNNYLNIEPVLARLAESASFVAYTREDLVLSEQETRDGKNATKFMVMARNTDDLGPKLVSSPWRVAVAGKIAEPWTDDKSTIIPLFR